MGALDTEFRDQLARRISSYVRRRGGLALQRDEIEAEIADVETRLRSAELLYEAEFGPLPTEPSEVVVDSAPVARGPMTGLAWGDALVRVLDEHGALHVKQIWEQLQDGGFQTEARDPLRSIVAIALREPSVIRVSPNTYALNGATETERAVAS